MITFSDPIVSLFPQMTGHELVNIRQSLVIAAASHVRAPSSTYDEGIVC